MSETRRVHGSMEVGLVCAAFGALGLGALGVLRASPTARAWLFAFLWKHGGTSVADRAMRDTKSALVREAKLSGRVLDVGSGTGTQLRFLCGKGAPDVTELVCIEPSPFLHEQLRASIRSELSAAERAGIKVDITLFEGTLERYSSECLAAGGSFDAVSCLLVLCSVPDLDAALTQCARLLKPGTGKLLFLEHVIAEPGWKRAVLRGVQPLWNLVGDGCQLCRDTTGAIDRVGERTGRWRRSPHVQLPLQRGFLPLACGICEPCE